MTFKLRSGSTVLYHRDILHQSKLYLDSRKQLSISMFHKETL